MGPCAGAAVYSPGLTDFIFMVKGIGQMYITGPNVIKSVTGEEVSFEQLGAANVHSSKSGNCHFVADNEQECLQMVRQLLSFLPQSNREKPAAAESAGETAVPDEELLSIVPTDSHRSYDMKKVIDRIVDNGGFMEVHADFGQSMITAFARMGGTAVGIVAQQPKLEPAPSPSIRQIKQRGSFASAIASISPLLPWWMCRVTCPAWTRNTEASYGTAPSCFSPILRQPCQDSLSCAKLTAALTLL